MLDVVADVPPQIGSLLASAAYSSSASGALLLQVKGETGQVIARYGDCAYEATVSQALISECFEEDDTPYPGGRAIRIIAHARAMTGLGFAACIRCDLDGGDSRVLVVCDPDPKVLSAAQGYVLQTLAAQIADQFELHHLRQAREGRESNGSTSEERLRLLESVVIHANDAVLITEAEPVDLPGPRITYANAAFTRTTGYTPEEVVGQTPRILQGPYTDRAALDKLKLALREWRPVEVELLNVRKDGTPFWVEVSIVPVADETGWYTHWVSVQRDITERKANEENAIRFRLAQEHNVALANEVKERMRAEAELAYAAFHDHLTGLRNRAFFMDQLTTTLASSGHTRGTQAIVFLDLDNFKLVNDSLGHGAGDLLLLEVAKRLKLCARPQDTIARMGGDEFTLLLTGLKDGVEATLIAEEILRELATPTQIIGNEIVISASIGLSIGTYAEAEHMLRDADIAMYRAKKDGGARYAVFNDEMHQKAMMALQSRIELRAAIERREFVLYYQPLVDITTDRIRGVEALLRWQHPERGLVMPGEFIAIAEETGSILQLGSWVLHEACRQFAHWQRMMPEGDGLKYSLNVSSRQLDDPGFFGDLRSALQQSGIRPDELELEITESVFLERPERVSALFEALRALHLKIAFDDFGTGYSSLSYLERFHIDTLKIDRSFVQRLITGHANADIVRMIVELAVKLGMEVSAEGVEDLRQRDALASYGCKVVQGYLYGRPVPFEEMHAMLAGDRVLTPVSLAMEMSVQ